MKIRVSEAPVGSCFTRKGKTVKKISDDRCASISKGKIRKGKCPSSQVAESAHCPISLLGAGLPKQGTVIEIGSPTPRLRRR